MGIWKIQNMSGIALDEISSNLQEFQGLIKLSKKFWGVKTDGFGKFQLWPREPPYGHGHKNYA